MPRQVNNITVADNGDGTASVQIGPSNYNIDAPWLVASKTFDQQQVLDNLRLAFLIGGYAEPSSREFVDAINKAGAGLTGLEGRDRRYFISQIQLADADTQTYEVGFGLKQGNTIGPAIFTIQIAKDDLLIDVADDQTVLRNLPAFFRVGGYTSLTPAALADVAARAFWQ